MDTPPPDRLLIQRQFEPIPLPHPELDKLPFV